MELIEWRDPQQFVRLRVISWHRHLFIDNQYIDRPRSMRLVWNYLWRVGPMVVLRKIRSRFAEKERNCKIAGIGTGKVLEAPVDSMLKPGEVVVFFSPNHRLNIAQIIVDQRFVLAVEHVARQAEVESGQPLPDALQPYVGWTPFAGFEVDNYAVRMALSSIAPAVSDGVDLSLESPGYNDELVERIECPRGKTDKPTAVLFGLGNYAKTQIIPHIKRQLDLVCIHEIDPDQLTVASQWGVALDTSPFLRDDERYDVWFIAGYHHTHAGLALAALRQGAYAVVEKPLATTWRQLEQLEHEFKEGVDCRFFGCFQRRYTPMNDWARQDLGGAVGQAINYYCIVYEIPLPSRHWYNWPASRSRLTSNGCHWLDHFLFLNNFADAVAYDVFRSANGDMVIVVELANGANFTMVLTDYGSERLGMRDYIELRVGDVTVQMIDQSRYLAESSSCILRKRRINPMKPYAIMYSSIAGAIARGESGDAPVTLNSTRLILMLEDRLRDCPRRPRGFQREGHKGVMEKL